MKFSVEIKVLNNLIHEQIYNSLREICDDLNLSYQQVADISSKRRNKFMENKFRFAPQIEIIKLQPI